MKTRLERLDWVVANRADGNRNELGRRAGLKTVKHVSILRRRLAEDDTVGMTYDTAKRIADAAGVRVEWLLDGEEPRDLPGFEDAPADDLIERIGRASGFSDEVIARARDTRAMGASVPTDRAALDLLHYARSALEGEAPLGARAATDDEFMPPRKPAPKSRR